MDASSSGISPPTKDVNSVEIRKVFADSRFFQRGQSGEFQFEVRDIGPALTRPGEQLPPGSREEIVRYRRWSGGRTIAVVHQRAGDAYGNPAPGTWADPKYVFHRGVRYRFSQAKEQEFMASLEALVIWLTRGWPATSA
jgi:hypothetical protein